MESAEIRRLFLEFFEKKGHQIVPSAPLVLKNDPTLLFTNSGMVQFKDYFLGNATPKANRIADTQKCLRVSGKHNDLEEVGIDTYHHTMFEMLGNWSFGDYFKKDAIAWAWELLTEVYKLPKDKLYVTVFGGDKGDNLPVDEEAKELWKAFTSEDHILHGNKKDNFWEMGDTGPCGPCSEIHIDLRPDEEIKKKSGRDLVNSDHPQVVEIWNLVFMEFNRKADGSLEKLPAQHVDTGMGFERLCMAIQKKTSNYDTDVFSPLINFIAEAAGVKYKQDEKTDIALRVMADHIRAVSFAICDGQLPSNTGAGYVIRRILRRAVRYGFTFLNFKEPFMHKLVPVLANQLKNVFPELESQRDYVGKVIFEEEVSFLRTLERGLKRIEGLQSISGEQAFELYDTFGFPLDLTSLIARERGFSVDEAGFKTEMEKQKNRSKADASKETGDWVAVGKDVKTEFIGYDNLESEVKIVKYRRLKQKNKELFQLVFDKTPFYAESGGQVGDTGFIESANEKIYITDTKKENELIVHFTDALPENLNANFNAVVDGSKRQLSMDNHSATHLLHAALRQVLGKHVEQKGSLVNDKVLRFDFSHFAAMTTDELQKVEDIVNRKIRENIRLDEKRNVPIEEAKKLGAMALFGEKYGDFVRVITFDPKFSVELCGGTHVPATGQIGLFKIISESSVAAGVRRIEAITADEAEKFVNDNQKLLEQIKDLLKNPKDLLTATRNLIEEKNQLEKKLEAVNQEKANQIKDQLAAKAVKNNGYSLIVEKISVPNGDALKNIAYALRNQFSDLLLVLAADVDGKPQVSVMIGEELMKSNKYHAGNMVKELAKEIDGGGGGQPFFATAGGKNLNGLDNVLVKAKQLI
ncbi:MAG TPA: alanine--tRNA ligase [Cyclobacteriaceae bacterium]|nr:alanine--tRNA ligase [Cyclobacteriaceae bacterium]HMV08878.1 alanine--tRNA ligase [Cyclobacteriaceae bacterium]HMV89303.1 alanine--tRNA ligase [Cyclobacteriaceae bacterium]HMX00367.1 alanine--tRNA ligase [Cyclobacteriaceae bacterium]HMX49634.1 alanine--tRNA ligase [Cyclobacteriaceae bacterium]